MKTLNGIKFKQLPFDLFKLDDLVYYEGPLISHFKDKTGRHFLMSWIDKDEKYNRWTLFEVSPKLLFEYFNGVISLKSLIEMNDEGVVYFIDINHKIEYEEIVAVQVENIPSEYLPKENSFFVPKYAEPYALELKSKLAKVNHLVGYSLFEQVGYIEEIIDKGVKSYRAGNGIFSKLQEARA